MRSRADELIERGLARAARQRQLPESTYRVQLHAGFTFRDAAGIVPYLAELGITHLYCSPYLAARPGSTHGYDVIDHCRLNSELGAEADFDELLETLQRHGMGHILDTVPNHVGVATNDNPWWNDVLENGPASRFATYFDIAWRSSPRPELHDKVLIPVLGEPYAQVLETGQLRLTFEAVSGSFAVFYHERRFPISPRTYARILAHRLTQLQAALPGDDPALMEYLSVITAARHLPASDDVHPQAVEERHREKEVIKHRLAALARRSAEVMTFIEGNMAAFNGSPGEPRSMDLLDDLLERQPYRLSYWHVASDEINYRRFFDVNDLAALRMERPEVFEATHRLILRLLARGDLAGLRIDHPDGLFNPKEYFERLQRQYVLACTLAELEALPDIAAEDRAALVREIAGIVSGRSLKSLGDLPLYVVAEKILAPEEPLPCEWAVHGTSGYDFLNVTNGLFVDGRQAEVFTRLYEGVIGQPANLEELVYRKKLLILQISLASELHMLAHDLDRIAQLDRHSRDFTLLGLTDALRRTIACFPVYRSYITSEDGVHTSDVRWVNAAVERAIARSPQADPSVYQFIRDAVLQRYPASFGEAEQAAQRRFAGKFQQLTAPVTAKGIEDTAFYIYNRFISLNEVGGEPSRFGTTPQAVHRYLADRAQQWPWALSTLSTHDTKRSEDMRARLNVLSELADEWSERVSQWSSLNTPHRALLEASPAPSANDEYLLYQTLVGAWPLRPVDETAFVARIQAYMEKATREAKTHTSWTSPNSGYESAVTEFVAAILDPVRSAEFVASLRSFVGRVSHLGVINSLSQTLLKLAAPGCADTYQGTELLDFSLVDPDNRRPVDYALRRRLLAAIKKATGDGQDRCQLAARLATDLTDGRAKLYVTWRALSLRRACPGLLTRGEYLPLDITGAHREHVFALARRRGNDWALAVVPRLLAGMECVGTQARLDREAWGDTAVVFPEALQLDLSDAFTGRRYQFKGGSRVHVGNLLGDFPVCLISTVSL